MEADNVYVGRADKIKCPNNDCKPSGESWDAGLLEISARDLKWATKNRGILTQVYRQNITQHGKVFYACAVITQLPVVDGEPQFEVEYRDQIAINITHNHLVKDYCLNRGGHQAHSGSIFSRYFQK